MGPLRKAEQKSLRSMRVSPRQAQILSLAADALTDKEIAARLGLSLFTIRSHIQRFYFLNNVHNRAGAVAIWLRSQTRPVPSDSPPVRR